MLVVATPCPLILAVPIAIVAGISRSAKRGIIVKGGGALETLARGTVLLFDKTGTLTSGVPQVADVEVVRRDRAPTSCCAWRPRSTRCRRTCWRRRSCGAARERGLELVFPDEVDEQHGAGIEGNVDGRQIALGKAAFVAGGGALPAARARRPPPHDARRLRPACSWPSTARSPAPS